jgi:hypothetical protein
MFGRYSTDVVRLLGIVAIATVLLYDDMANRVVITSLLIGVFLGLGGYFTRRIASHKLDLNELAKIAMGSPIGAAIVFASLMVYTVSVMWISIAILK